MDAKAKAQRSFHWEALKEAVGRMRPELKAASDAAHEYKDADTNADDDEDYSAFDRTVELGYLVQAVSDMCGPHLALLCEIADVLPDLDAPHEADHQEKTKQ